jgi:hypothetical protein
MCLDELLAITLRVLSERALGRQVPDGLIAACLHQLSAEGAQPGSHLARVSAQALHEWQPPAAPTVH